MEPFPRDFLWGVATAAYQMEGAAAEDGKGEGIWDVFCRTPGRIRDGSDGTVACNHYHLWERDLALLGELGVNAYRFSVSWPRILPQGKGEVNQRGLDFYSRLIDSLLERGITPLITLWHGDHPQALEERGGWANRDMIGWFADFASLLFATYGDRARHWITLNEPNCFFYQGLGTGSVAPGVRDWRLCYQALHHALVGHGETVRRLRQSGREGGIGMTMSVDLWSPASDSPADTAAAELAGLQNNWWILDPLYLGQYPPAYELHLGSLAPRVAPGDAEVIGSPCDFLGVNYYGRNWVRAGDLALGQGAKGDYATVSYNVDAPGLVEVLRMLETRYGSQAYCITENGLYRQDSPPVDGICEDPERVEFLQQHLSALSDALRQGIDVRGYFFWTLMDNFEWSQGHLPRLGLYYTDYTTQARIPKRSALWYREFLREQREGTAGKSGSATEPATEAASSRRQARTRSGMPKPERHEKIVREVLQRGSAPVVDLASQLGVSQITIRRDLDELDRSGRLERFHGGAQMVLSREPEPLAVQRQVLNAVEKRAIGLAAAEMVHDGDVIGLGPGSTPLAMAVALASRTWKSLQIVTNSLAVANQMMRVPGVEILLVGGSVRQDELGTFGWLAQEMLARLSIGQLFVGCHGLDPERGLSTGREAEGVLGTHRTFASIAKRLIVLADHTKLGQNHFIQVAPVSDIDVLVTDSLAPDDFLGKLQRQGVATVVAPLAREGDQ